MNGMAATINSVQDGDWRADTTWDSNSPGCTVTDDVVITHTVTSSCSPLDIKGTGSITVKSGGKLIVESDAGVTGDGDLTVESGGELVVKGNMDISGSGTFTLNGSADVYGNFDVGNGPNSTADGSGDLEIGGCCCSDWDGPDANCSDGVPLPVDLISFEAEADEGSVTLNWATASERNSKHFIVQRSSNGSDYRSIGKVKASGNSVIENRYRFEDSDLPGNGTFYYRLVQVDLDGKRANYGPVSIEASKVEKGFDVHPVPFSDRATIELPVDWDSEVILSIRDMTGRKVAEERYSGTSGQIFLSKEGADLEKGAYMIRIRNLSSQKAYSKRVLVQ